MGFEAEAVENEEIEVSAGVEGGGRDGLAVGDDGGGDGTGGDFPSEHVGASVNDGQWGEEEVAEGDGRGGGGGDSAEVDMPDGGAGDGREEEVVEFGADGGGGAGGGKHGEGIGALERVGAEVVESREVVGVVVGEEDAVEGGDFVEKALGAEVGGRVEEEAGGRGLEEDGGAEASVARVGGGADGTGAPGDGDAVGGAGAKEEEGEWRRGSGHGRGGIFCVPFFSGREEGCQGGRAGPQPCRGRTVHGCSHEAVGNRISKMWKGVFRGGGEATGRLAGGEMPLARGGKRGIAEARLRRKARG